MVETLKLENVSVLAMRAEEIGRLPAHREQYDLALARAVAPLPVLVEYLLPLLKRGGIMRHKKGIPRQQSASKRSMPSNCWVDAWKN